MTGSFVHLFPRGGFHRLQKEGAEARERERERPRRIPAAHRAERLDESRTTCRRTMPLCEDAAGGTYFDTNFGVVVKSVI